MYETLQAGTVKNLDTETKKSEQTPRKFAAADIKCFTVKWFII